MFKNIGTIYRVVRHLSFVSKHLIEVKAINIYAQEMYEEIFRHLSFVSKHLIEVKTINIYAQEMYEEISIQNTR
jgi:hypothetical protein